MAQILSISDLNTEVNHEPRIADDIVANRLGYERPTEIKRLIERNTKELAGFGEVCVTATKTSGKGGRPGKSYFLNEGQALVICALSRTPKAAEVRKEIIKVFMAFRRGELVPAITNSQQHELQRLVAKRVYASEGSFQYFWGSFNRHFKLPRYSALPADQYEEGKSYIQRLPAENSGMPATVRQEQGDADRLLQASMEAMNETAFKMRAMQCIHPVNPAAQLYVRKVASECAKQLEDASALIWERITRNCPAMKKALASRAA